MLPLESRLLNKPPTYLLDPQHGLHELGGVSHRDAREATIPVHQVVVHVAPHQTQHVLEVELVTLDNRGRDTSCQKGECVHL